VATHVSDIAGMLQEQDAAVRQIAINVEKIACMAQDNNLAADENSRTAQALDRLAGELRQSVGVYRV
jgi:methyl-accepting chemotaxis protein